MVWYGIDLVGVVNKFSFEVSFYSFFGVVLYCKVVWFIWNVDSFVDLFVILEILKNFFCILGGLVN